MSSPTTQNFLTPPLNSESIRKILGLDDDDQSPSSPGITTFFCMIPQFLQNCGKLITAIRTKDKIEITKKFSSLCALSFGLAASAEKVTAFVGLIFTGISAAAISLKGSIFSIAFLGIELILEVNRLRAATNFRSKYLLADKDKSIDAIKTDFYLTDNQPQKVIKLNKLASIIRVDLISRLDLYSHNTNTDDPKKIYDDIDLQVKKAIKVHAFGIAAIAFAILTIGVALTACPPAALICLTVTAMVMQFIRSSAPSAYLDRLDHKWSHVACLPQFLQRKFFPQHKNLAVV